MPEDSAAGEIIYESGHLYGCQEPPTPIQMPTVSNNFVSLNVLEISGGLQVIELMREQWLGGRRQMSRVTKSVLPSHNLGRTSLFVATCCRPPI